MRCCLRMLYAFLLNPVSCHSLISPHMGISLGAGAVGVGVVLGGWWARVSGAGGWLDSPISPKHCCSSSSAARLCCFSRLGSSPPPWVVSPDCLVGSWTISRLAISIGARAYGRGSTTGAVSFGGRGVSRAKVRGCEAQVGEPSCDSAAVASSPSTASPLAAIVSPPSFSLAVSTPF